MSLVLSFLLFVEMPSCCSMVLMLQWLDFDYFQIFFFC